MTEIHRKNQAPSPEQVVVGIVLGAHGVNGELRVRVLSDVSYRFDPGQVLHLQGQPYNVASSSRSGSSLVILKLDGINTPVAARSLLGQEVTSRAESSPALPEGEYFHYQLIGLQVLTESGERLGEISEIIITGSNDVYVVSGADGEILLPALNQVIRAVDLERGLMTVRLMEGLR